jgi:hypothetical protein
MNPSDLAREPHALVAIRKLLLGTLAAGVVGTSGELVLLGHVESFAQWIPLVLLGASVAVIAWHWRTPTARSVRTMQTLMALFVAAGALGVGLHFDGNAGFERELHPSERGWAFLRKTVAGATPVLAPGSMVLLGLVGVAHTYRHPSTARPDRSGSQEITS